MNILKITLAVTLAVFCSCLALGKPASADSADLKNAGLKTAKNTKITEPKYEDKGEFSEGLAPAKKNGKWGYISLSGKEKIDFAYSRAFPFSGGRAVVANLIKISGQDFLEYGWVDSAGKYSRITFPLNIEGSEKTVGIVGPVNLPSGAVIKYIEGNLFIPDAAIYDNSSSKAPESRGGIIINTDSELISDRAAYAPTQGMFIYYDGVSEKYIFAPIDPKPMQQEAFGKLEFDDALPFSGGIAAVKMGGSWKFIALDGSTAVEGPFKSVKPGADGPGFTAQTADGKWVKITNGGLLPVEDPNKSGGHQQPADNADQKDPEDQKGPADQKGPDMDRADMPSGWAAQIVSKAETAGFVPENLQGRYKDNITRLEFAQLAVKVIEKISESKIEDFILKTNGRPLSSYEGAFTDTDSPAAMAAKAAGIIQGTDDFKFLPNANIRRQDAALILKRLAEVLRKIKPRSPAGGPSGSPADGFPAGISKEFKDASEISAYAKTGVDFISGQGIMTGNADGKFLPHAPYSREQSYITIYRLAELLDK